MGREDGQLTCTMVQLYYVVLLQLLLSAKAHKLMIRHVHSPQSPEAGPPGGPPIPRRGGGARAAQPGCEQFNSIQFNSIQFNSIQFITLL